MPLRMMLLFSLHNRDEPPLVQGLHVVHAGKKKPWVFFFVGGGGVVI